MFLIVVANEQLWSIINTIFKVDPHYMPCPCGHELVQVQFINTFIFIFL